MATVWFDSYAALAQPSIRAVTAKLKERHIVAAIECTDYCDFLVDLFHDAER